jgi:hypothetical protein
MSPFKMVWTGQSQLQFDELRQRALQTHHFAEFIEAHNEIVAILHDLDKAIEKGDPLYNTKKPGGVVRHLLHRFISVTYTVFAAEQVGWVISYLPVPSAWPEQD